MDMDMGYTHPVTDPSVSQSVTIREFNYDPPAETQHIHGALRDNGLIWHNVITDNIIIIRQ